MARRKNLKGVAVSVAERFVSRNNNICGYWGIGVIYGETECFELNLLTGKSQPETDFADQVAIQFREQIFHHLLKLALNENVISEAKVILEFNLEPNNHHILQRWKPGAPYACEIVITDDLGRGYSKKLYGWCRKHSPSLEQQSTRY